MQEVPRSIEEIYKISNRNRKRNKEKRKLKEESTREGDKDFSPIRLGHDLTQMPGESVAHPSKRQKTDDLPDREFMSSIGWTSPQAAPLQSSESLEQRSSAKPQSRSSGVTAENFTPFDYSAICSSGLPTRGVPRGTFLYLSFFPPSFLPYMNS